MISKIGIILILVSATLIRLIIINQHSFPFAQDMGRDLIWAKDISFYGIPTLIGPAASIWGVFFGPLWFYLLAIPLRLFDGNPISAVYVTLLIIILTGFLIYYLFQKILPTYYSLVLTIIFLFSNQSISISTFAFHANVLPLLTLLMIYFIYKAKISNWIYLPFAFLSTSLMFHADPAPAVVFSTIPFFFFFYFKFQNNRNIIKIILYSLFLYVIPFVPQIIFEFRNNFVQSKSLITYFTGNNPSLSGQLPLFQRIQDRLDIFFNTFINNFSPNIYPVSILTTIIFLYGIYIFLRTNKNEKLNILFKVNFISILIIFILFTFIINVEIKSWYLYPLTIIYSIFITYAFIGLKIKKWILVAFLFTFILLNLNHFFEKDTATNIRKDPATFKNQMEVINSIYNDDENKNISVYTYTPPIYDYNYQYIFWWLGIIKNQGLPSEFAYLPDKTDYVRNKNNYKIDEEQSETIYLIIENSQENEFYSKVEWLKNFNNYKLVWNKEFHNAISLQKRTKLY